MTVVYDDIAIGNPAISLFLKHGLIKEYRKDEIITKYMDKIDELLQTPCWIIDILPAQVPAESAGQYFAVEKYFLKEQLAEIKQKHINVILKLNCYLDVAIDGETNPAPARISAVMNERYVYIMTGDSMILSEPDDTHLSLFNPDEKLLELVREIATSEGLFAWKSSASR